LKLKSFRVKDLQHLL